MKMDSVVLVHICMLKLMQFWCLAMPLLPEAYIYQTEKGQMECGGGGSFTARFCIR